MNRYKQREQALLLTFESQFHDISAEEICTLFEESVEELGAYSKTLFNGVYDNKNELDAKIEAFARGWRLSRIPKINIAILRIALYEIQYVDDVPASVAVNEAVELAKKYSGSDDASFINGILGSFVRSLS